MTKRTPLQEYREMVAKRDAAHNAADEEFESKRLDAIERSLNERDKIIQAETDPSLSREERQKIFRSLRAWPRIALGIYETELAIAKKERREKGPPEYGRLEPSEIAADAVGNVSASAAILIVYFDTVHKLKLLDARIENIEMSGPQTK